MKLKGQRKRGRGKRKSRGKRADHFRRHSLTLHFIFIVLPMCQMSRRPSISPPLLAEQPASPGYYWGNCTTEEHNFHCISLPLCVMSTAVYECKVIGVYELTRVPSFTHTESISFTINQSFTYTLNNFAHAFQSDLTPC